MIKLAIAAVVLIAGGVAWLRMQWAVEKNKKTAGKIIDGLKNGTYDAGSFEESLGMTIRKKQLTEDFDQRLFSQRISELTNNKLLDKFKIDYAVVESNGRGIVIAEAAIKDVLSAGSKEVTVTYPCWLYLQLDNDNQEMYFKSSMPDGKDHHHLLEDISDVVYERCVVRQA